MIDVNKITSTLAKLPDQQLQQYAQMHKNDPYIMALAMSESNRRKELRAAGQGEQDGQEQPKVVDQMVAEMAPQQLPEEQGIGQLPAGDMNFANGGIIAFADGGDVERYQVGGSIFDQMDQQKAAQLAQLNGQLATIESQLRAAATSGDQQSIQTYAQQAQAIRNQINAAREATGNRVGTIDKLTAQQPSPVGSAPSAPLATPPTDAAAAMAAKASASPYVTSAATPKNAEEVALLNRYPTSGPKAAPTADTTRKAPGAGLGAAAGPKATSDNKEPAGLDSIMAEFTRNQELAKGAAKNADVQYASSLRGEAAKLVADEEKRIKDQVDPYKDREARLLKQEKGLEGMGDKYLGLALLQAGAAMMTTPGGVGVALGKGVQVGSERYIAGIDKINAAKDKFAEARDRLDDLRLNRSDMNARDIKAAKTEARTLERQAEALFYTGAREDLKMTDKNLTTLLGLAADDLKTTRQINAERENTLIREGGANTRNKASTDAAMQSPERLAFLSALEKTKTKENPKGDPAAAYQSVVAMKADPRSQEKLRGDWLDMAKRMQIQADYPNIKTFDDYVAVFGGGAGGGGGVGGDGFRVVGVRPAK